MPFWRLGADEVPECLYLLPEAWIKVMPLLQKRVGIWAGRGIFGTPFRIEPFNANARFLRDFQHSGVLRSTLRKVPFASRWLRYARDLRQPDLSGPFLRVTILERLQSARKERSFFRFLHIQIVLKQSIR